MERIIDYHELPYSEGESIYFRMETDPKLYLSLISKGYKIVNNIFDSKDDTLYVTGKRQTWTCESFDEYKALVDAKIQDVLKDSDIDKPNTTRFNFEDLLDHKYKLPFVLKNENQNGGREKFLIQTEEDYENLIDACSFLIRKNLYASEPSFVKDDKFRIDYDKYLNLNFCVQEYIETPSEYNTTVRLLTSPSNDLLYAALKYKEPEDYSDDTTLLGYLLSEVFPLSTKSIVSNTLSGGKNLLLGQDNYREFENELLDSHNIKSDKFDELVDSSLRVHKEFEQELGIICGFDYIYNAEEDRWYLLEYHSRPMVGDYSIRQGIPYETKNDRISAEGRVRATALSLTLKKNR